MKKLLTYAQDEVNKKKVKTKENLKTCLTRSH